MRKSIPELQEILVAGLWDHLDSSKPMESSPASRYCNAQLGLTSSTLAALLDSLLWYRNDWNPVKWLDDALLINFKWQPNELSIWGVMIWGVEIEDKTDQWTDLFYFSIKLSQAKPNFEEYSFYFADKEAQGVLYEKFVKNRDYWDLSKQREWKYILRQKGIARLGGRLSPSKHAKAYNEAWTEFFAKNANPTVEQILAYAQELMLKYSISINF